MMIVDISEEGRFTLPPEALAACKGAGFLRIKREFAGGVLLAPEQSAGAGAAPVADGGGVMLTPEAMEIVKGWGGGRRAEVIIEDGGCLVLTPPEPPGTASMRKKLAERGVTGADAADALKWARRKMREEDSGAVRKAG